MRTALGVLQMGDWLSPGSSIVLGSIFNALGYVTGAAVYFLAAGNDPEWRKLPGRQRVMLLFCAIVAGALGAKLSQWLYLGWPFRQSVSFLEVATSGRTIVGGLICGWLGVELMKWRLRIRWSTGLPFALALPAGEAVGRIGCWFNGCCGGIETSSPFAVEVFGVMRHPTQLYHALAAVLILLALLVLKPYLADPGHLFRYYLLFWGLSRLVIEAVRIQDHLYYGLSLAQWLSLELAAAGGISICWSAFQSAHGLSHKTGHR